MTKLSTLIIVTMLMASVSGFFKGKSHSEPSEHYEWSVAPKYETIHVVEHQDHFEESKKGKKWSWLPSWPWKKNKKSSHETHYKTTHVPFLKFHKLKGVKVQPVRVVHHHSSTPVHNVQPIIYHHHSSHEPIIHEAQHITHSQVIEEIPSPVYHHEVLKEIHSPVYHHEIHTEESNHVSPEFHHPVKEEIHEVHVEDLGEKQWKWPERGASKWAQLDTQHNSFEEQSNEEAAKEIISSFLGEGHSIDTLEKLMPTLHKDKNLFNKLKQFHHLKSSWLPKITKTEGSHEHDEKKSKTLFNFLPKIFSSHSVQHVPEVIDTYEHIPHHQHVEHTEPQHFPQSHAPVLESFHVPTIPYIPVAYPIHQTVSTTVIEHPKKVYQIEQYEPKIEETKKVEHSYEQQNSHQYGVHHTSHQLHNSYGHAIPNDSYSSASENNEVVVPAPITHNSEQQFSETADIESTNQKQDSITLKSTQELAGTK